MAGNAFPINLHSTFEQKVKNFPDNLYYFNEGDNITTLMKILLGNSGTGQLQNLQVVARLGQQHIEFDNLDVIMGLILQVKRASTEIYSFATNPFIDQLSSTQWQEVISKDASYRERLLGAAEAFQAGVTLWGILTLCEALTQFKFYVVESWRTPNYGRQTLGVNPAQEIVLIPLIDGTLWKQWDQNQAQLILGAIQKLLPANFIISFGQPITSFTPVPLSNVDTALGYSEYFNLERTANTTQINTPVNVQPESSTRYWVKNNGNGNLAPYFAHLQTQEIEIDLTGNIVYANSTDSNGNGLPLDSVAKPSVSITSTVYGAQ